jgi:hypothetical protein
MTLTTREADRAINSGKPVAVTEVYADGVTGAQFNLLITSRDRRTVTGTYAVYGTPRTMEGVFARYSLALA